MHGSMKFSLADMNNDCNNYWITNILNIWMRNMQNNANKTSRVWSKEEIKLFRFNIIIFIFRVFNHIIIFDYYI